MKPAAYYQKKEQTYLKHFFLERYLETVAFHITPTYKEFAYIDCFSGPWRSQDEDLGDTSIRIALDKLNVVHKALDEKGRSANIQAIFIEKDQAAFSALETALQQHSHAIKTAALPGTFEDNIPTILQRIGRTFAFFFIDPTGWGCAMDNIRPILQHQPGEVMVNFMYDFINRFLNYKDPANEESLDRFFGTTHWRDIRQAPDREEASVKLYMDQLRTVGGYTYVTSTRILKPLHNRAYFHLVYATRSPTGIVKFRDVEKKFVTEQESVRAVAQRADRETRTRQTELAFAASGELSHTGREERTRQLQKAETAIYELLRQGPIPYETLQPRILQIPLVWNTDLNTILLRERKAGGITIQGFASRQRTPRPGNTIQLAT